MNPPKPVPQGGVRAVSTAASAAPSGYSDKWERMWSAGLNQGDAFDARRSAPSLVKFLSSPTGKPLCVGKSAIVPGCGRGYDLITLAELGASRVVGLELSETAVKVAEDYVASQEAAKGKDITMASGDWLAEDTLNEHFDLGYDYTFFCALHPGMRESWADGWARRIAPGGHLVALCFPVTDEVREGPPWPVSVAAYEAVLAPRGFKCVGEHPVPEEDATVPARVGKEILTIWTKTAQTPSNL